MNSSIWKYSKNDNGEFKKEEHPGYVFLPLVER